MSELEVVHEEVGDDEVHFRENEQRVESPIPPIPVTTIDMDVIIRGWEEKFEHLSRCLRDVQLASEKANSDMCDVNREGRARGIKQERRLQAMHVGITDFLQKCEPTHLSATRQDNAPTASTPYAQSTPTGIPVRLRLEFDFHQSPVSQDELMEPARSPISHVRDHDDNRNTHTRDHELMEPAHSTISHVRDHDDIRSTAPVITSSWNLRAARYRTSGITMTSGIRAPVITSSWNLRAARYRTSGITMTTGIRAPVITTTFGTRASENMTPSGTRAPTNSMTTDDSTNDQHTRMTGGTAVTYNGIHIILE